MLKPNDQRTRAMSQKLRKNSTSFYNRGGKQKLKVFNNLEKVKQMSVNDSCQGQTTRLM